ncbi:uncharacterized protein HMPREF1541_05972 [Cyphellophora europaea CBS 101466]|uniref:pH-response transcription factor pacC/RIM101 n=1 Tax=Cyphellophora europaea (strain CBS 101466) TaxID=1220924 RepID=W2RTA4_CYPE1|nr:uncharacterized protein HMPREF1541_05972 [Cyphellophora europaea CBS 101466]ETN39746.1 hypothetical protein HMPREF1541_05972 [Cyphellophora europaea CBS 101466]
MTNIAGAARSRSYICERCGRAFSRSEHLNRHVLAHDKRKPFRCSGCGTSYGRADVLHRHTKKCPDHLRQVAAKHSDLLEHDQSDNQTGVSRGYGSNDLHQHGMALDAGTAQQSVNYSDFAFDNDMFLEDTLLFQFNYNHSGLTIPSTPNQPSTSLPMIPESSINPLQLATPESVSDVRSVTAVHNALQITLDELQIFHSSINEADPGGVLKQFRRPSLSRTLRCLIAYYQHFDLHTPIVHFASLKISDAHPALILIMLAIGAVHLSEQKFAESAYEASCLLLAQHETQAIQAHDTGFHLWYAQAAVLCAQFGACTGDPHLFHRAQSHLFAVQNIVYRGLPEIEERRKISVDSWATWIFAESCSRVISWMFIVSAMCLALDPSAVTILPPMPCSMPPPSDESAWHAVSEPEWRFALQMNPPIGNVDLWTLTISVMVGETPENCGPISAFALLAIMGAILATICTKQRLSMDIYDPFNGERKRMEKAIATWEGLWRRHPRAERNMTRLDHPLLNDCLSLLGSSYYHLYLGQELDTLKKIANNPRSGLSLPPCQNRSRALKVIKFAANSWLVRAKLGITYLNKTGGLELGSQAFITAYESALILAWWLNCRGQGQERGEEETSSTEDDRAAAAVVQRLFDDILNELDEQGVSYDESGNPVLSPVDFYLSVLDGRVWRCATIMDKRLRDFASVLKQSN